MRKIVFVLVFLVVLCSCAREKAPEIPVIVPVPEPVPLPVPEPVVIEPMPEPVPPPEQIVIEPMPQPEPVPVIPGRPSCRILKDQGLVYTLADVAQGKISMADYNNLRICYPYFAADQADTDSKCCII